MIISSCNFVNTCFFPYRENEISVHGVSDTIVGVLGGGQLGQMLCQAASQMGIKVMVLDPLENCPASALAYDHVIGRFDDSAAVQDFANRFFPTDMNVIFNFLPEHFTYAFVYASRLFNSDVFLHCQMWSIDC